MLSGITEFFSAGVLAPHAICLLWRKDLIAIHGVSDLLIALSYFAIPLLIVKGTRLRPDLIDRRVATLFAMFIMACGISHLAGLLTLWFPYYGWQALVKLLTAGVSMITVYNLWRLWPDLMRLPSSEQLASAKAELIAQEKIVELTEQSNAKLQEFAYTAAHDLRAPLNTLSVIIDLMEPDLPPSEIQDNTADMSSQINRMQTLIDDLLNYATIGTGEQQSEVVDVATVIADVLEVIDVPPAFDIHHETDSTELRVVRPEFELILRNVIKNAIIHHDQTSGTVEIRISHSNNQLIINIADDGPGIPDEHKQKIFNMFYRIKGVTKNAGSWMGLAAVARAVDSTGGTIQVLDRPDTKGALFRITLPQS